jgi:hypothetical protein
VGERGIELREALDVRQPAARPRTARALLDGNDTGMQRARATGEAPRAAGVGREFGGRVERREAEGRPVNWGRPNSPWTISMTPDVELRRERPNFDSSTNDPEPGIAT